MVPKRYKMRHENEGEKMCRLESAGPPIGSDLEPSLLRLLPHINNIMAPHDYTTSIAVPALPVIRVIWGAFVNDLCAQNEKRDFLKIVLSPRRNTSFSNFGGSKNMKNSSKNRLVFLMQFFHVFYPDLDPKMT